MLTLYDICVFVEPQTIEAAKDLAKRRPDLFMTESFTTTDHVGDTGVLSVLSTPNVEFILAPFNHFHYRGDFEIGLTILPYHSIAEFEHVLLNKGFQFESGHFGGNLENEYYLIPRKDGVFTPFFVISNKEPKLNRFLRSVPEIHSEVTAESLATTEEFANLLGPDERTMFAFSTGQKRRFLSAATEVEQYRAEEERVEVGEVEMTFHGKAWDIKYRWVLPSPTTLA